ncbi:flagellar filament capping protein FliD [Candidatus Sumerlaeota bacterium]|nr:flagellar filament capping protein FliD [Candidatus Sumerlaeota bacterium]
MSLASSTGIISGLPVDDIITAMLTYRQLSIRNLQSRISDFQQQQQAYIGINNTLLNLQQAVSALTDASSFRQRTASSGDPDALEVTAGTTATPGSFSVEVLQLASSHRLGAQGFADTDTTAVASASGSLSFRVGSTGVVHSISVDATTTLADLRDAINAEQSEVRASIINDGSATNPHRLVLTSTETGAENEIIFVQNDTTLDFENSVIEEATAASGNTYAGTATSGGTYTGTESRRYVIEVTEAGPLETAKFRVSTDGGVTFGPESEFTASATPVDIGDGVTISFSAGDFAEGDRFQIDAFAPQIQTARDAVLKVDGVTLTRSGNTVANAIEGVTLDLLQATSGAVSVSVANDTDSVRGAVVTFIEQFNVVIDEIAGATAFDAETEVRGVLLGDSAVRNIARTLTQVVTSTIPGLSNSGISSLASIGITLDDTGHLNLDSAKFEDALANDLADVEKMFATVGESTSTSRLEFISADTETTPGTHSVVITQIAEQAEIQSNQDITGPLSNAEILTFTVDGESQTVSVAAGLTLDEAVEAINSQLDDLGLAIEAAREGDRLRLFTSDYGSSQQITVRSNQSGASSTQLGIGTTDRTDTGQDVAGTIGGQGATGEGQVLTAVDSGSAAGLEVRVLATTTGYVGSVTVSTGVGIQLETLLDSMTDSETGALMIRQEGLGDSISDLNDQIEKMQDRIATEEIRLRSKYASLETLLAGYNTTSSFLSQQLSQLSTLLQSISGRN